MDKLPSSVRLPDEQTQSLFQDDGGRIWAFTGHGLAYFKDGRFAAADCRTERRSVFHHGGQGGQPLAFRESGSLALAGGTFGRTFPWSALGRHQQAKVSSRVTKAEFGLHSGRMGVCCISRMVTCGRRTRPLMGWAGAMSPVFDSIADGALWAGPRRAGSAALKMAGSLRSQPGMVCPATRFTGTIEDDDRSLWLYTACGLVRITRSELDAWIADPKRRIQTTVWDAADGVRLQSISPAYYGPPVAKSTDGKLWFVTGEGIQVVDPHHLAFNRLPPPVRIEQIVADHKIYWQNLPGAQFRTCVCRRGLAICRSTTPLSA